MAIFFYDVKTIYFADEGESLTVGSSDHSSVMAVAVSVDSEDVATFRIDPYNGLAVIPIGDILMALDRHNSNRPAALSVRVTQGGTGETMAAKCVYCRRVGDGSDAALYSSWLSTGPRERTTYLDAPETLQFLIDAGAASQEAHFSATLEDGSTLEETYAALDDAADAGLDVSPSTMQLYLADAFQAFSPLEHYSVWIVYTDGVGNRRVGEPIRFLVKRERLTRISYAFVNSRGAYEYIHATGQLTRGMDSEIGTFLNAGVEREYRNDSTKTMEQNSGHIGNVAEAEFWLDFLASRERHILEADGTRKGIVVEGAETGLTDLHVGELSFTWHYANKNNTIVSKANVPVRSIAITGPSIIEEDGNQARFGVIYSPANTTQRTVTWRVVTGAEYASINSSGILTVAEGAVGATVTIRATSTSDGGVYATKSVRVTYRTPAAPPPTLDIYTTPADATVALTIGGVHTTYHPGMEVDAGTSVSVSVSKQGYATLNDSFAMPQAATVKHYALVVVQDATASYPGTVDHEAQHVPVTISDPAGHGWLLEYSGPDAYAMVTGGGVVSGNAVSEALVIRGTGSAQVYLAVSANSSQATRPINVHPFYFKDLASGTTTNLYISQLGYGETVVPVTSVTLNKSSVILDAGDTETLTAEVLPADATNKGLSWTTSNASVATVSQGGRVTAVGTGTATITARATDGSGKSSSCAVTVTGAAIAVTGVALDKSSETLEGDGTVQLTATVSPPNAGDNAVSWTTSKASVATVSQSGLVTAVGTGTATITVRTADGGYTATCAITVVRTVQGIAIDGPDTIRANGLAGYFARFIPTDTTQRGVNWTASLQGDGGEIFLAYMDDDVFLVEVNGQAQIGDRILITAISSDNPAVHATKIVTVSNEEGMHALTIETTPEADEIRLEIYGINTVYSPGMEVLAGAEVTVTLIKAGYATLVNTFLMPDEDTTKVYTLSAVPIAVTGVALDKSSETLGIGGTVQLTATVSPSNAGNNAVSWTTSKASVATVSQSGLVTAVGTGTATITVHTADGGYTATCGITVGSGVQDGYALTVEVTPAGATVAIDVDGEVWEYSPGMTIPAGAAVEVAVYHPGYISHVQEFTMVGDKTLAVSLLAIPTGDYEFVEYVTLNRCCGVLMPFQVDTGDAYELGIDFQFTEDSGSALNYLFGRRDVPQGTMFTLTIHNYYKRFHLWAGTQSNNNLVSVPGESGMLKRWQVAISNRNLSATRMDTGATTQKSLTSAYDMSTVARDMTIGIGAAFDGSTGLLDAQEESGIKGRIYGAHLKVNEAFVFRLVPARRLSDGVYGLFDEISGTFFSSMGINAFGV